jgi:hypothetical protein
MARIITLILVEMLYQAFWLVTHTVRIYESENNLLIEQQAPYKMGIIMIK